MGGGYYVSTVGLNEETIKKYIWYSYDSRFALPVYTDNGEVERYNVYHASMLIRHANDGKMYLYDILDIKKETSNPFES